MYVKDKGVDDFTRALKHGHGAYDLNKTGWAFMNDGSVNPIVGEDEYGIKWNEF